jgi:hypothetical protein
MLYDNYRNNKYICRSAGLNNLHYFRAHTTTPRILKLSYILLSYATTLLVTSVSFASDPAVKLLGGADFQVGHYTRDADAHKNVSADKKYIAFNNTAYIAADAKNTLDSGLIYGAQIALTTAAKNSRSLSSYLYIESGAGKWELGSNKSAYGAMKITGYTGACATAGGWDIWTRTDPINRGGVYITNFGGFLDPKLRSGGHVEYARKITYYTPELKTFQLGISYIPDTTNVGGQSFSIPEDHDPLRTKRYKIDIKDGVALGITHKYQFTNNVKVRTAVVGESGKPVQGIVTGVPRSKWKKLRTYTIGTTISCNSFTFSAAYMNYMKSLTSKDVDTLGRNTHVYGATLRYNQTDKWAYSLSHFTSKHKASNMNATTLATEYKIVPGLVPYAEVTFYKTRGKHLANTQIVNDGHKGTLVLLGAKIVL